LQLVIPRKANEQTKGKQERRGENKGQDDKAPEGVCPKRYAKLRAFFNRETIISWEAKYNPDPPRKALEPHKTESFNLQLRR
jgi:hypothetical protein